MGLTIHYSLRSQAPTTAAARTLVLRLHQRALDLPFDNVGEIIELKGDDCNCDKIPKDAPNRWMVIQARQLLQLGTGDNEQWAEVAPIHLIAFTVHPADGCEPANIGLCRYPKMVVVEGRKLKTGLDGWCWKSFCKTQYASNPGIGGIKNFVRAHTGVAGMLDAARGLGITIEVKDEGGYFEQRDIRALVEEVHEWNTMIAGAVGELKDAVGNTIQSEISKFPDFEHFEAEGRAQLPGNEE